MLARSTVLAAASEPAAYRRLPGEPVWRAHAVAGRGLGRRAVGCRQADRPPASRIGYTD